MSTLTQNRRAFHDYEILEKWESGIVLTGAEVKSVKGGHADLQGSYVTILDREPFLTNCNIAPYRMAKGNQTTYDPRRKRRLLLKKEEIRSLIGRTRERGLTLIPLTLYTKKGLVKLEIGLGRGRKKHDRREQLKKRAIDREIQMSMRGKF